MHSWRMMESWSMSVVDHAFNNILNFSITESGLLTIPDRYSVCSCAGALLKQSKAVFAGSRKTISLLSFFAWIKSWLSIPPSNVNPLFSSRFMFNLFATCHGFVISNSRAEKPHFIHFALVFRYNFWGILSLNF